MNTIATQVGAAAPAAAKPQSVWKVGAATMAGTAPPAGRSSIVAKERTGPDTMCIAR